MRGCKFRAEDDLLTTAPSIGLVLVVAWDGEGVLIVFAAALAAAASAVSFLRMHAIHILHRTTDQNVIWRVKMKYRKSKVVCVLGFMPKARLVRPFFKIFTCDMPGLGSNTLGVKNTRQRRQSLDAWSLLTSFKVWKPAPAAPGQSSLCHAIFVQSFWRVFQVGAAIAHCISSVAKEVMPKALEKSQVRTSSQNSIT